jgi:hypothetical protein
MAQNLSDCIRMICSKVMGKQHVESKEECQAVPNSTLAMVALICKDARDYVQSHFPRERLCILSPHDGRYDPNVTDLMKFLRQDLYNSAIEVVRSLGTKIKSSQTFYHKLSAYTIERDAQPVALVQGSLQHPFWIELEISGVVEEPVGMYGKSTIYKIRFILKDTLWFSPTRDTQGMYVAMKEGRKAQPYRVKRSQFLQTLKEKIISAIDCSE